MTPIAAPSLHRHRRTFVLGIVDPQTWRDFAFHLIALPLSIAGFTWFVLTPSAGIPFAALWVGLPVAAFLLRGNAWFGTAFRALSNRLLGTAVDAPSAPHGRAGIVGWTLAAFRHGPSWRALAFGLIAFVTSLFAFIVTITVLVTAAGLATNWVWTHWLTPVTDEDGVLHSGLQVGTVFVDTPQMQAVATVVGFLLLVLVWPPLNRWLAAGQAALVRALLGSTASERRVDELTRSRDDSVRGADDTLRRVERDLHDGTQARLVALAMTLGDAQDRLDGGGDPAEVGRLVENARRSTQETIAELREIARGIHPAALDEGLEAALASAVSRTTLPVSVEFDRSVRLSAVTESVAYFTVVELLTNVTKHARATRAAVTVARDGNDLLVTVEDDGVGGAHVPLDPQTGGTGLAGVADRLRTVDGTLAIDSPSGGPTRIALRFPGAAA
ncbi:sensor histidine kinase [Curtobacterium sp. ZW137]|uniref:sensor histidine kinase n=1 Tax=Curtobacterium sp. ZW137 TaxID=2485104 RepID=UPI000F4C82DF|nr:sensor histidine kinase [Curtobacterium sp. ZW137]ROP61043.1 signal transduction histidine kinase [Curtobacterium sp. ZW137]